VGTWVQPEELEDLEIFEERETGRKKIQKKIVRDEKLKRKQQKKGDLLKGEVTKRVRRGIREIEEVQEAGTGTSAAKEASTSETGVSNGNLLFFGFKVDLYFLLPPNKNKKQILLLRLNPLNPLNYCTNH